MLRSSLAQMKASSVSVSALRNFFSSVISRAIFIEELSFKMLPSHSFQEVMFHNFHQI